jgi:hypothetical protein
MAWSRICFTSSTDFASATALQAASYNGNSVAVAAFVIMFSVVDTGTISTWLRLRLPVQLPRLHARPSSGGRDRDGTDSGSGRLGRDFPPKYRIQRVSPNACLLAPITMWIGSSVGQQACRALPECNARFGRANQSPVPKCGFAHVNIVLGSKLQALITRNASPLRRWALVVHSHSTQSVWAIVANWQRRDLRSRHCRIRCPPMRRVITTGIEGPRWIRSDDPVWSGAG